MIINVQVKPGSKKGPLVQPNLIDDTLAVYVREPAVDGKANRAVLELLADYYGVPKSRVEIIRGHTARTKAVRITAVE
jgi:uncharacterized protein (TIGR00251 family)